MCCVFFLALGGERCRSVPPARSAPPGRTYRLLSLSRVGGLEARGRPLSLVGRERERTCYSQLVGSPVCTLVQPVYE